MFLNGWWILSSILHLLLLIYPFFYLCGSGSEIPTTDPDPLRCWIRIQFGSGPQHCLMFNPIPFASNFIFLGGSVFGMRIHKVTEYGTNLDPGSTTKTSISISCVLAPDVPCDGQRETPRGLQAGGDGGRSQDRPHQGGVNNRSIVFMLLPGQELLGNIVLLSLFLF